MMLADDSDFELVRMTVRWLGDLITEAVGPKRPVEIEAEGLRRLPDVLAVDITPVTKEPKP